MNSLQAIEQHQQSLRNCQLCNKMIRPVVVCQPVASQIMLVGQAPGVKEGAAGKPFAWTAGKTLFKWFSSIGLTEEEFRRHVYMAAVCRCFPGKNPKGGDRLPDSREIENCSRWLAREYQLLSPKLLIPVGKLAISQYMQVAKLKHVIGQTHSITLAGKSCDAIPLPHPSGLSTWHRMEPGKQLLQQALQLIQSHPAWQAALNANS